MIVLKTLTQTGRILSEARKQGKYIGLVPTMGALHSGHMSLLDCCKSENDTSVVSIFVNPTQFNDAEDLKKYPRSLEQDLQKLKDAKCDFAFVPDEKTIYPEPDTRVFNFGKLEETMEGSFRPGHFNGVAQVVSRLFQIVQPDRAYFGEKDIQQVAIIRKMTEMLKLQTEIRACPTLRESDGLAMSSRNVLLSAEQRKNAAIINRTLKQVLEKTDIGIPEVKEWVINTINGNPEFEVEYFEIVDSTDMQPVMQWNGKGKQQVIGCIAVRAGKIRLIDNIFFPNFALL